MRCFLFTLFLITSLFAFNSCKDKNDITGKWHIGKYTSRPFGSDAVTVDLSDTAFIGRGMRSTLPSAAPMEELIKKAQNCFFEFNNNGSFRMYDIGIIHFSVPGIRLGKELKGTWQMEKDSTIIVKGVLDQPIEYKIINHTPDSLILGQYPDENKNYIVITRLFKK